MVQGRCVQGPSAAWTPGGGGLRFLVEAVCLWGRWCPVSRVLVATWMGWRQAYPTGGRVATDLPLGSMETGRSPPLPGVQLSHVQVGSALSEGCDAPTTKAARAPVPTGPTVRERHRPRPLHLLAEQSPAPPGQAHPRPSPCSPCTHTSQGKGDTAGGIQSRTFMWEVIWGWPGGSCVTRRIFTREMGRREGQGWRYKKRKLPCWL